MKLLLDENLSRRLTRKLANRCEVKHVFDLGLREGRDRDIWSLALNEGWIVVTKDADFVNLSTLLGGPPKVIRLAVGNCSNEELIELFDSRWGTIEDFSVSASEALLVLHHTEEAPSEDL